MKRARRPDRPRGYPRGGRTEGRGSGRGPPGAQSPAAATPVANAVSHTGREKDCAFTGP